MLLQLVRRVFRSNLLVRQTFDVRGEVEDPDVQFRLTDCVGVAAEIAVIFSFSGPDFLTTEGSS